jgi:protein dithiol oxidoreductase (disulfide-forming)
MKRRHFSATVFATGLVGMAGIADVPVAHGADNAPVEGTHYVRLSQPVASGAAGKIEVIEFFWYGCPHCNAFEPTLEMWSKKLPGDVAFHRVPVAFSAEPFGAHQRIFYALESLGLVPSLHRKVFYAIHNDRMRLDKPADIAAFMEKNGVDGKQFLDTYNSFGVATKARQATQQSTDYKIDGVPAIGVQGRYYTSGPLAGSNEKSLAVADYLIQRVRRGS